MNNNYISIDDRSLEKVSGGYFGPTEHTVEVTAANYESIIRSAPTVLISAGASWAGPSSMLNPVLEELAAESSGKAVVGILDVDLQEQLAIKLNIRYIPTTIKYVNGVETDRQIGYQPIDVWRKIL